MLSNFNSLTHILTYDKDIFVPLFFTIPKKITMLMASHFVVT